MALKKEIELDNGIILNYHRIVLITKITNVQTNIEVASYTSEEKRNIEKEALINGTEFDVYIHTTFFNKEYNEVDTIENLYDYLKTTEMFENAENS
jgi:hypothetical protein